MIRKLLKRHKQVEPQTYPRPLRKASPRNTMLGKWPKYGIQYGTNGGSFDFSRSVASLLNVICVTHSCAMTIAAIEPKMAAQDKSSMVDSQLSSVK